MNKTIRRAGICTGGLPHYTLCTHTRTRKSFQESKHSSDTLIYEPSDHPEFEFLAPNPLTIKDVLEDVNAVRHDIAHGDKIPDRFFSPGGGRQTLDGLGNYLTVLDDTLSFIIRETLLKILRNNLIEDFKDRHRYPQYWKTLGV